MSASISLYEAFEPETTLAMGEAFDEVCKHLNDRGQPKVVRDVIAKQIIEAAKHGERNPAKLRESVMATFGFKQPNG
jgi:tartrate dehydratase beta subunit/fumarate hydratase class I family protein